MTSIFYLLNFWRREIHFESWDLADDTVFVIIDGNVSIDYWDRESLDKDKNDKYKK